MSLHRRRLRREQAAQGAERCLGAHRRRSSDPALSTPVPVVERAQLGQLARRTSAARSHTWPVESRDTVTGRQLRDRATNLPRCTMWSSVERRRTAVRDVRRARASRPRRNAATIMRSRPSVGSLVTPALTPVQFTHELIEPWPSRWSDGRVRISGRLRELLPPSGRSATEMPGEDSNET